MTLNHDIIQQYYATQNLTLQSERGDQGLLNGVNHIKIGPLLKKLEVKTHEHVSVKQCTAHFT